MPMLLHSNCCQHDIHFHLELVSQYYTKDWVVLGMMRWTLMPPPHRQSLQTTPTIFPTSQCQPAPLSADRWVPHLKSITSSCIQVNRGLNSWLINDASLHTNISLPILNQNDHRSNWYTHIIDRNSCIELNCDLNSWLVNDAWLHINISLAILNQNDHRSNWYAHIVDRKKTLNPWATWMLVMAYSRAAFALSSGSIKWSWFAKGVYIGPAMTKNQQGKFGIWLYHRRMDACLLVASWCRTREDGLDKTSVLFR
jgi:hypothetical protein